MTSPAQGTHEFGAARFVAPAGFTLDSRPTVHSFTRIRGRELCVLVVYGEELSPPEPGAAFANAWSSVFQRGYRRAPQPAMRMATSPAGYMHAVGEGDLEDDGGNRYIARLHVFPVGGRSQTIIWMSNSRAAMDGCLPDWTSFFASLRFPKVQVASGAPAPGEPRAAVPAMPATPTPVPVEPGPPGPPGTPQQFNNVTFIPPRGWTVRRGNDGVHLAPTNARGGEWLQVSLLAGRPAGPSIQADFAATWRELAAALGMGLMTSVNGGNFDLDEPARALRGWDYLRGNGGMRRDGSPGYNVDLYLIRAAGRSERVAVVSRDFRDQDGLLMHTSSRNAAWDRAIREFVFTLRFVGQPETPLTPARVGAASIAGVWNGISMSFGSLKTQFAIFFDNGLAYFGPKFPRRGLHEIDPSVEQPAAQRYWGTWTLSGGQGVLTMPYGTVPLRVDGPVLVLTTNRTPHRFIRRLMPPGPRLDGTWCLPFDPTDQRPGNGACLTLDAAGRFQDGGAVLRLEHATHPFPESPPRGEGRYRVVDYTLVLQYDSGSEIRIAFPGVTENPTTSPLNLTLSSNEDVLRRR